MANNRFQLKQFAQNADNNGVFGSYSAGTAESSSDPETIQSLPAWLTGWLNATTSASILPRLEEMQGLQFVLCKAILENTKEGIPSWLPTETYYKYSVCSYYDDAHPFDIYINKTGTWTTTNPAEDTTNWISGGVFFRDKIIPDQSGNDGKVLTTDGTNIGWEAAPGGQAVGQIIQMLCTPDYIPSGCLPCDGAEYAQGQFSDLWENYLIGETKNLYGWIDETEQYWYSEKETLSIGDVLTNYRHPQRTQVVTSSNIMTFTRDTSIDKMTTSPLLNTCTYAEYASDISTYGQCAKFGVDTVNNKFKVPTIKDGSYITQALSDGELGKSYNESLPNITGSIGRIAGYDYTFGEKSGVFSSSTIDTDTMMSLSGTANDVIGRLKFNASNSSSVYQNGAKVQGDNVRMRFFVVVANGQINQSMMDWSAWASSLNGKANADLSNMNPSQTAKETIVGWGMPDYTAGISVSFSVNIPWTAPSDGILVLASSGGTYPAYYGHINETVTFKTSAGSTAGGQGGLIILSKNDTVKMDDITVVIQENTFVPFKGVN